jgi:hypothetical protein
MSSELRELKRSISLLAFGFSNARGRQADGGQARR